jgi:Single Cache domain 2
MINILRTSVNTAVSIAFLALATSAFAQQQPPQFGSSKEAMTMLLKTVAAVKADPAKAIDTINKGEGGFLDRDLYPFCFQISDGKVVAIANPNAKQLLGQDARTLKDSTGKAYGMELYAAAAKSEVSEVSYMFPRPGNDTSSVPKISFVTKAGDLGCGVGYYKWFAKKNGPEWYPFGSGRLVLRSRRVARKGGAPAGVRGRALWIFERQTARAACRTSFIEARPEGQPEAPIDHYVVEDHADPQEVSDPEGSDRLAKANGHAPPTPPDVDEEFAPALRALPHSGLEAHEFLLALGGGADQHKHAFGVVFHSRL